jgi:murein hydrolase activator
MTGRWFSFAVLVLALLPAAGLAQSSEERLRAQREELARIRREREELEQTLEGLRGRAHSISEEAANIDRQRDATRRLLKSLDSRMVLIGEELVASAATLARTERDASSKRGLLRQRMVDIYKHGATYEWEALLGAKSFGELIARYKYLRLAALHDKTLIKRMEEFQQRIKSQRDHLLELQEDLEDNRAEKAREEERLRALEQRTQKNLARVQREASSTKKRLDELARSEARLNNVIANLIEAERKRAGTRTEGAPKTVSTVTTADLGKLAWPVEGDILYRFGREVHPNNTVTRWNGIGIAAALGTPVKAVSSGTVAYTGEMGTYGKTVIIEHGGGDYSVYSSLEEIRVTKGAKVTKGATVGTVGASDPALPPRLHFEIRSAGGPAIDPFTWLREQ